MPAKKSEEPCKHDAGCGFIASERNRYFTGKYMAARDFSGEQEYFLSRHRLHNRLLHGWGIVCGLRVVPHPREECRDRWVVVRAGIAIDCCGRELILPKDTPFELPLPPKPEAGKEDETAQKDLPYPQEKPHQHGTPSQQNMPGHGDTPPEQCMPKQEVMTGEFLLCVRYTEKPIEYVPALYTEGTCDPARREANRVREVVCLDVCSLDEVKSGCWPVPNGDPKARCRDDCDDELPGPAGICLEPECPCGEMVPLALIRPKDPKAGYASGFDIDMCGRRHLPTPPEFLTHIVSINWDHGGEVSLSHLRDDLRGRLEVRFDRKLLPAKGDATGINAYTFIVQYGGVQRDIEFLPFDRHRQPALENDCLAVFTIDPQYLEVRDNIANNVVYVTLKCDFILDCHGNPVDGSHLRGQLPTGDGVAGGVFESWFRVA
jgi:hypothetical protein